eukprot:CAMPEP_0197252166 /NCGR_PEP_ID=MMETSP1429-20130617/60159_1 /TAXON_ID=49237 /ORGANISM="Chaetoceros  sp., Strain UNC1202" /LENGTH=68 /DNA_ID=CAMNT_0042714465 /DNA_START=15 /DNA_END=218 /DNA_ORIENTATION=+
MSTNIQETMNNVIKIDLTNASQFEELFIHYRKNPFTINFWLNASVFQAEMDQFPQRLVGNSWHLAHNP